MFYKKKISDICSMFALVDCNNFYASCERAFNPQLIDKPIVVLSNNDGCVIARSNEAKALGIPMGAPAYQYKNIFQENNVCVFSSNFALYGDMSHRVMTILSTFSPDIEIYSIDEAFIQLKGYNEDDLFQYASGMRDKVKQCTQIPISIGIAHTKALSKIANKIAKKFPQHTQGVYCIKTDEQRIKALKWTKIEDVWGIGRRLAKRLKAIQVYTAYDFTQLSDSYTRQEFTVVGLRLKQELEGISVLQLDEVSKKKSIATTRSFASDINDFDELKERISTFSTLCAEKLRKERSVCKALTIFIRSNAFNKNAPQHNPSLTIKLPYHTNNDFTLSQYALKGLKAIYRKGYAYKKAGIIVMDIRPDDGIQQNLFAYENPKYRKAVKAIDELHKSYGKRIVKLGTQNPTKTWIMRRERLSKRYTTSWNELLEVK